MPTAKYFDRCTPFSADGTAQDIPTLSLALLEQQVDGELERLFAASREFGFFRLDLRGCEQGCALLGHAETMLDVSAETFTLDKAILDSYAYKPPKDLVGYKTAGNTKNTDDGKFDATEMYTLSQDDMLGNCARRNNPSPLEAARSGCSAFFTSAGGIVGTILHALDKKLGLAGGTLSSMCRLSEPSDTSLRMLLSQPSASGKLDNEKTHEITLGGHTDIGIITILFNVVGGLQILPAAAENAPQNWRYIEPRQGCAIVNLGDTIVEWTGGLLRSSLHRVVRPPGRQAEVPRQSLAYLVRPARSMTMQRLRSPVIPSMPPGEKDDTSSVSEWATIRASQIIRGELRPRTMGGLAMPAN